MRSVWSVFKLFFPAAVMFGGLIASVLNPLGSVILAYGIWLYYGIFVSKKSTLIFSHAVNTLSGEKTVWGIAKTRTHKDDHKVVKEIVHFFIPSYNTSYILVENIGFVAAEGRCSVPLTKNFQDYGMFDINIMSKKEVKAAMANPASLDARIIDSYENNRANCRKWMGRLTAARIFHSPEEHESIIIAKTASNTSVYFPYCNCDDRIIGIVINDDKLQDGFVSEHFLLSIIREYKKTGIIWFDEKKLQMVSRISEASARCSEEGYFEITPGVRVACENRDKYLTSLSLNANVLTKDIALGAIAGAIAPGISIVVKCAIGIFVVMAIFMLFAMPFYGIVWGVIDALLIWLNVRADKKRQAEAAAILNSGITVEAYMCDGKYMVDGGESPNEYYIKSCGTDIKVTYGVYDSVSEGIPYYHVKSVKGLADAYYSASSWVLDEEMISMLQVRY